MVTDGEAKDALKQVIDPELGIDVVSLGLIYKMSVEKDRVSVVMTFTFPGCPYGFFLVEEVKQKLLGLKGVKHATVEVTFDPPWKPPEDLRALYGV